ncbi:MAG TPA: MotA/TolQ/ExbB proton channel family protein [Thermoanaerobaculia bacterium]|nr:MotA/TolQ/ExbB proton channel family protein [Thermoanaerobaculia bacterium]
MDMSLMGLIKTMSPPALAIFFLLCLLSVYSLAVSVERWMTFQKAKHQSVKFALEVGQLLKQDKLREAIDLAKKYKNSHVAKVVSAGLLEFAYEAHGSTAQGHDTVAAAERAVERAAMMTTADLKKGLGGLATIATTAPFIGLLGTVIGIINAFRGMAASGAGGLGSVSAGIAEALVTTALGLFVAIPAVWLYNLFINKIERFQVEMSHSSSELIDYFMKRQATKAA